MYAFHTVTRAFRKITSGVTPANVTLDESAGLIVYQISDRKMYSFSEDEAVAVAMETKTFPLTDDPNGIAIRHVALTYKSGRALTLKVYLVNEIVSGKIETDIEYAVTETPYVNGSTFKVTYNGTQKMHGGTFTGVAGNKVYTVDAGAGVVGLYKEKTFPLNNAAGTRKLAIRERATKMRLRIEDTGSTTTDMKEYRLTVYTE